MIAVTFGDRTLNIVDDGPIEDCGRGIGNRPIVGSRNIEIGLDVPRLPMDRAKPRSTPASDVAPF
jgi:hypothetical protein